jgi:hypothetical protein
MALTGTLMFSTMMGKLAAAGMAGPQLPSFCNAVASGSVLSVIGKPFNTVDVGLIPGIGVGIGVGILGIAAPLVMAQIIAAGAGLGLLGPQFPTVADAIATGLVAEAALATLSSFHTPVFLGVGTIIPGSILVVAPEWASNVQALGTASGFLGGSWPSMCQAIGIGCTAGFPTATGIVVIAGSPTFIPVPGGGAGFGFIS